MSPKDTLKMQSGTQTNIWETDTTLQTQKILTPSALSTSASTPYSGDLQNLSKINTELPALSQLNMDSESLTKKGKIGVVGDPSTEVLMQKNPWHKHSSLEVIKETPQNPDIDISGTEAREREEHTLAALAQLIPTHITRPHIDSIDGLSSLAARMSQIAATTTLTSTSSLGRALGAGVSAGGSALANTIRNLLGGGGRFGGGLPHGGGPPPDEGQPPDRIPLTQPIPELEEGEILQTLEEGEILLTADSPINY
jgi:hypothetical protein